MTEDHPDHLTPDEKAEISRRILEKEATRFLELHGFDRNGRQNAQLPKRKVARQAFLETSPIH